MTRLDMSEILHHTQGQWSEFSFIIHIYVFVKELFLIEQ